MKFLHTADWHLGKRLHDFPLLGVQREAIEQIIALVERERPDAVLLAGDVFDTYIPQLGALELWEMAVDGIVGDLGTPMVVIPGNHDHPERLAVHSNLAKRSGLHIIKSLREAEEPVVIAGVPIYGVPYHKPVHVNASWRDDIPAIGDFDYQSAMEFVLRRISNAKRSEGPAVLMAHAFVAGSGEEGDAEDPIQVGDAGAVSAACFEGFAYVALGHIHGCRSLGRSAGLHYCGSPLKYSFDEAGHEKSVTMVELDDAGAVTTRRIPLTVSRDVRVIEGKSFEQVIDEAAAVTADARQDYLLVKVTNRDPIDRAIADLREQYPNALLQQPAIEVQGRAPKLEGDYRTLSLEDSFRQFYQHTYGEEIGGLEEELMWEALHGPDEDEPEPDSHSEDHQAEVIERTQEDAPAGEASADSPDETSEIERSTQGVPAA